MEVSEATGTQPQAQRHQRQQALTDAELNAVSYFAIGAGSEGSMGGRDVSRRLSFAGDVVNGVMAPIGNSGFSIGTLQIDLGQHPEVARTLVDAYQDWARANHPQWVLSANQRAQTVADLGRNGDTIRAQGGRDIDAEVKSHLDQFLRSEDGARCVHRNDVTQANKLMREVYTPLRETALYRNATPDDQVRIAAMVGKAYNQSEVWGHRIMDRIDSGHYRSVADVSDGVGGLLRGEQDYMQTGRDAAVQGAEVVNALRNGHTQSPLRATWDHVLAADPLVDPTRLDRNTAWPDLPHEYATVKDLFLQKGEALEFIQALDRGATSMHGRTDRQGAFNGDGLMAAGNNFLVWDRNGIGHARTEGLWRDVLRDQLVRTQNADRSVDLSVKVNGQESPLMRVDPRAPNALRETGSALGVRGLSAISCALLRDSEKHVRMATEQYQLPWDAGMDNTVCSMAERAREAGLTAITHFKIRAGTLNLAQSDGYGIREVVLDAHVAANTPAESSLDRLTVQDRTAIAFSQTRETPIPLQERPGPALSR